MQKPSQRDEVLEGRLAYYLIEYADGRNSLTKTIRSLEALILLDRSRQVSQARIEELQRIDISNIDNGINFHTDDKALSNGWKTMRQYTAWRIAQLEALKGEL